MTKRKLSSLLFTLILIFVVSFLQQNSLPDVVPVIQKIPPSSLPIPSEDNTVLGTTDSAKLTKALKVKKVIDGDTIELEGGETIRYIGIDTPETKHPRKGLQCFGKEAKEKNRELVEGKEITIEKDVSETDRYGRLLRFVYVDGIFINDYLVRQGYAISSTFPPDVKYQEQFRDAEKEARENNRGLWGSCK